MIGVAGLAFGCWRASETGLAGTHLEQHAVLLVGSVPMPSEKRTVLRRCWNQYSGRARWLGNERTGAVEMNGICGAFSSMLRR